MPSLGVNQLTQQHSSGIFTAVSMQSDAMHAPREELALVYGTVVAALQALDTIRSRVHPVLVFADCVQVPTLSAPQLLEPVYACLRCKLQHRQVLVPGMLSANWKLLCQLLDHA